MKIDRLLLGVLLTGIFIGCGANNQNETEVWHYYDGAEITENDIITVSQAVEQIEELIDQPVVVQGVIKHVCQSRGCWMIVEEEGKTVRVRFADYGFFVPWESAGKVVRMQGTLNIQTVSEEQARHWAEEAGDPEEKPEDIHGDQEVIQLIATGAAIKGGTPISPEQQAVIEGKTGDNHEHDH